MKAKIENGILKVVELPNAYKGVENVINGYALRTDLHEQDGFFDVVYPSLQANEKYGELLWSDYYYIYEILTIPPKTQEQIDAETEAQPESEVNQKLDTYQSDGDAYFRKIRNFIYRNYQDAVITKAQFLGIKQILQPALLPLKDGNWDIAQDSISTITPPTNAKLLLLYNKVKTDINEYVLMNY